MRLTRRDLSLLDGVASTPGAPPADQAALLVLGVDRFDPLLGPADCLVDVAALHSARNHERDDPRALNLARSWGWRPRPTTCVSVLVEVLQQRVLRILAQNRHRLLAEV